jgi:predicted DNA-binding transcriptional regulator YafY
MRADRLLTLLMLLQTRGTLTAAELAADLEVTERTIYRDVIALSTAGIPVYTERGPGGGIALVENYRTDLTGLRPEEASALSMLEIPEPLIRLGVGTELKTALLKLSASIPSAAREQQTLSRQRIHLDAAWWFQSEEPAPHLGTLQQAVWQDRMLRTIHRGAFDTPIERVVAPYGLVAKATIWYLVYRFEDRLRARRVSQIIEAEILPQTFRREPDFDLVGFWQRWCADYESDRPRFEVSALVAPGLADRLHKILVGEIVDMIPTPPDQRREGWRVMRLTFESFEVARTRLLGFGSAVEVLEPLALRLSIADYAEQIKDLYKKHE